MTDEPIYETEENGTDRVQPEGVDTAEWEPVETGGQQTDERTVLAAELETVRAQAAEYLDGWQRARAEFTNYRRRQELQQRQAEKDAQARLLTQLLPAIDDMGRALSSVPSELCENPWVGGLSLVEQKWLAALDKAGVSVVPAEPGQPFDPNYHEALTHEPSAEHPAGTVIEVLQRGYQLGDAVLRPALVRVSSGQE